MKTILFVLGFLALYHPNAYAVTYTHFSNPDILQIHKLPKPEGGE